MTLSSIRSPFLLTLLVAAVLAAGSCSRDIYRSQALASPFQSLLVYGLDSSGKRTSDSVEAFLEVHNDFDVGGLLSLESFGDLRPGFTSKDVEEILGPSVWVYMMNNNRDEIHVFEKSEGLLEVVMQKVYASDGSDYETRRFLKWRPHDRSMASHLSPKLLDFLTTFDFGTDYSVSVWNEQKRVRVDVIKSEIEAVVYLVAE